MSELTDLDKLEFDLEVNLYWKRVLDTIPSEFKLDLSRSDILECQNKIRDNVNNILNKAIHIIERK